MQGDTELRELRNVLEKLYPREPEQRRVLWDAQISAGRIAFDQSATTSWYAILTEVTAQGRLPELIEAAAREYPVPLQPWIATLVRLHVGRAEASLHVADAPGAVVSAGALVRVLLPHGGSTGASVAASVEKIAREGAPSLDSAAEAVRLAEALCIRERIVTKQDIDETRRDVADAEANIVQGPPLTLNRAAQRMALENLIVRQPPPAVAAFLAHGEADQGHERVVDYAGWRMNEATKRACRRHNVRWPSDVANAGTRINVLLEQLARAMSLSTPIGPAISKDPLAPSSAADWDAAVAPVVQEIAATPHCWLLVHTIARPRSDDPDLVAEYLRRVWTPVARVRARRTLMLAFAVLRGIPSGMPWFSAAWRISRREQGASMGIVRSFDAGATAIDCASALPELASVLRKDVVAWLRERRKLPEEAAEREAREALATTRGGRFDAITTRFEAHVFTPGQVNP
jgi:hypothetical protein